MPPQLDDIGTKQLILGTPNSADLIPFYANDAAADAAAALLSGPLYKVGRVVMQKP